jgi:hypothetical protein
MLETINGIDLVLALLAAAGWTAWRIERTSPLPRPRRAPVALERRPYDWARDGL